MKKYITGDLLHYKICNAKFHINNVSKIIGLKRIKLSQGTIIHIQNELVLALKELEEGK